MLVENRDIGVIREPPLWYPFIGEFAGLIQQQHRIYIRHQQLLINPENALMSSIAFGGGLAGLTGTTPEGHEKQNQQYKG